MALTSEITCYDPTWPARFQSDKPLIACAFGDELIDIHHVGSTSVPGLVAKPEIDVLIEVRDHRNTPARDMEFARTNSTFAPMVTKRLLRCSGSEIYSSATP